MKNIKLLVPILFAGLLCIGLIGCGENPSGGGAGVTSSGKSGRLVDPYIEDATVFVDVNGNGLRDTDITAEMIATTEGHGAGEVPGRFTFTSVPSLGATIRILVQGIHLGVTYDAGLARYVDGVGGLNISPMTTLLSYGISAESIVRILKDYAAITVEAADVKSDPMSGLNLSSSTSIAKIRGSIAIYCLLKVLDDIGATEESTILATIEGSAPIQASLANMGLAIRTGLDNNILHTINVTIDAISASLGGYSNAMPHATATDVANSAFAITRYVVAQVIANAPAYSNPVSTADIEAYARDIGQRFYLNSRKTFVLIPTAYPSPIHTLQDAIDAGYIQDSSGNLVTSAEVNSTTEAFGIDGSGNITPIWQ